MNRTEEVTKLVLAKKTLEARESGCIPLALDLIAGAALISWARRRRKP